VEGGGSARKYCEKSQEVWGEEKNLTKDSGRSSSRETGKRGGAWEGKELVEIERD